MCLVLSNEDMLTLTSLLSAFPEAIILLDKETTIHECSGAWLQLVNKSAEETRGKRLTDVFPPNGPKQLAAFTDVLREAIETGKMTKSSRIQYDLFDEGGRTVTKHWDISVQPIRDSNGGVYLVQRVEDVTAQVVETGKLEELVRTNRMTSLIIRNLRDHAVILLDMDGVIKSWNPAAERIKGYTESEIVGRHFSVFYTADDLTNNVPAKALELAFQNGRHELEGWRKKKDGSTFWADVVITRVDDENDVPIGYVKITRDLTEKKNAESALVRAFEESTRQRAEFTASMSHEIRNPMNGVVSAAKLLQTADMSAEEKNLVGIILDSSESLLSIVNDILDYTKLDVSHFSLVYKPFDLQAEITYIVNLAKINGRDKTKASILLEMDASLPSRVDGDGIRLRQVLTNLLDNAIKFTPEGSIRVKVWGSDRARNIQGDVFMLHVSVEDTGFGIPESEIGKLFKPFSQTSSSTRVPFRGSGLGLSICKRILELMGGRIQVQSVLDEGTTFTFVVPLVITADAERVENASTFQLATGEARQLDLAQILIVDDSDINRRVVERLLFRLGYKHVDVVENGLQAVNIAKEKQYDLVLMDLQMPIMNGYDASRELRKYGFLNPIIALTGDALPTTASKCREAGMNACLVKPLIFSEVSETLAKFIKM